VKLLVQSEILDQAILNPLVDLVEGGRVKVRSEVAGPNG
jgi:hypothetical protein